VADELVMIARFTDPVEAALARNRLLDAGFRAPRFAWAGDAGRALFALRWIFPRFPAPFRSIMRLKKNPPAAAQPPSRP
jgi:hypothetical protein